MDNDISNQEICHRIAVAFLESGINHSMTLSALIEIFLVVVSTGATDVFGDSKCADGDLRERTTPARRQARCDLLVLWLSRGVRDTALLADLILRFDNQIARDRNGSVGLQKLDPAKPVVHAEFCNSERGWLTIENYTYE